MTGAPLRELDRLLAAEITRRLLVIRTAEVGSHELWAALHSLKGSIALAGYAEFALVIGQARQRLAAEPTARDDFVRLLEQAERRLLQGLPPLESEWPEPPPWLAPGSLELRYKGEYRAAIRERLGQLDAVLSSHENAVEGLERAQRTVHAMKGAASALGDDATAWYCHGLESELRAAARTEPNARDVLVDLGRHRALLALLVDEPARGLLTLQALARAERQARRPPSELPGPHAPHASVATEPPLQSEPPLEAGLHVPVEAMARLLERLDRVELVHDDLGRASVTARRISVRLREVRAGLGEALRLLGPARPWGPSLVAVERLETAAGSLLSVLVSVERGTQLFRRSADFLRARSDEMRAELSALQRTSMSSLFERVTHAGEQLAAAESKLVRIETSGADVRIDRRVADRLYDALLQLVRNAIAHGIQSPAERTALGRAAAGNLWLSAERREEWLRIRVADDGVGADVERARALALQQGALSAEVARTLSEDQLLGLLFLPGVTTRPDPGLLAGRGLGLDLVQETARVLGGAVRLENRDGGGFSAILEIPLDQALTEVLWVEEGGHEFAIPVHFTSQLRFADRLSPAPRLGSCFGGAGDPARRGSQRPAELELELAVYGVSPLRVGIDRAGLIEEVTLRALPRAIASAGPYAGAILRSDGSLRLALDVPLLAAQVFAA